MRDLFRHSPSRPAAFPRVSVQVSRAVLERIRHTIADSRVEEGGKLLGRTSQDRDPAVIEIDTFIDSGPTADQSSGHLLPDAAHQDSVLSMVQGLDPSIAFVGSWHSHHCNGLPNLSFGDERGYTETVNSPEYAGNLFLALLITGLRGRGVDASYYLFVRGMEGCLRLKESQISYTAHEHLLEPVLREIQGLAVRAQAKLGDRRATRSAPEPIIADGAPDPLRQARTEDSEWLQRRFPGVVTLRDTRTGAIGWKWHSGGADGLMFRYEHPPEGSSGAHARLRLFRDGQLLADHQVPVDATRFAVIEARVGDARQLPGNAVVSGCDAADGEERLKGASEAAEGGERSCP